MEWLLRVVDLSAGVRVTMLAAGCGGGGGGGSCTVWGCWLWHGVAVGCVFVCLCVLLCCYLYLLRVNFFIVFISLPESHFLFYFFVLTNGFTKTVMFAAQELLVSRSVWTRG